MPRASFNNRSVFPPCALCGAKEKLERSHIIPQFVYRWASATAGRNEIPTGRTRPLLCGRCEDLFSAYESEFARKVFHPFTTTVAYGTKYDAWLRKFAASVCWRIIEERSLEKRLGQFNGRWAPELSDCRATWQQYLVGRRPDVGAHHLHLLRGSAVGNETDPEFRSTIEYDVSCTDHEAFVYAKLGPLTLFGLIAEANPKQWEGTRLNAEGKLKPREVLIPTSYRDFIISRACRPA